MASEGLRARIKGWAKRLGVFVAVALLCIGCGELTVRVAAPQKPVWADIYTRHPRLPLFALRPNATYAVDTRETKWSALIDGDGHRVLDATPAGDKPVVLWLGDSFTFGHGIDYQLTFIELLEARGKYRAVNAGVPGYGPVQYRRILEDMLAQGTRPAAVVVMSFLGNDFDDCIANKDLPVVDGVVDPVGGMKSWLQRQSHFYRLAMKAYMPFRARSTYMSTMEAKMRTPDGWNDPKVVEAARVYRDEFARIQAICQRASIPLAVGIIPSRGTMAQLTGAPFPDAGAADYLLIPSKTSEILKGLGVRYLDLGPALAAKPLRETYFNSDGHFTAAGHRLVADALAQAFPELAR